MALWQFTTIAALIGVLLIYVMVLTNRIGATNALLKRIEEALVRPQPITENPRGAMAAAVASAPGDSADEAEVSTASAEDAAVAAAPVPMVARLPTAEPATESDARETGGVPDVLAKDRRVSFLTVRDLKVIARSGRRSSDSTVGMSPLFREAMERKRADTRSMAESDQPAEEQASDVEEAIVVNAAATEEVGVASKVSHEVVEEGSEPHRLPVSVQELATATYEPAASELTTADANEFAEAAAATSAANEHAATEGPSGATIFAADTHAAADAPSMSPTANEGAAPEARDVHLAANNEARGEASPANFASHDESAAHAPIATSTANEDSKAEAISADENASAEAATGEQPTAAQPIMGQPIMGQPNMGQPNMGQPIDEALLERRRKRDAQLILSAQRRRRRTRGF